MPQLSRHRRRNGRNDQGNASKKRSSESSKQPGRAAKKRQKHYDCELAEDESVEEEEEAEGEELFKVEKIVDCKPDKNGVPFYKTRWKGYSAADDTWEPSENVASTGHIDRYERQQRQRTLKGRTSGVAVIEYEDGERETIDMRREKFRGFRPDKSDHARDDDSVSGDDDVNDHALITEGAWIEILWRHTNMYFPCKIISYTPLRERNPKIYRNSIRRGGLREGTKDKRPTSDTIKRGGDDTGQRPLEEVGKSALGYSKQKIKKPTSDKSNQWDAEIGQRALEEVGESSVSLGKKKSKNPSSDRLKQRDDGRGQRALALEEVGKSSVSLVKKKGKKSTEKNQRGGDETSHRPTGEAGSAIPRKKKEKKQASNRFKQGGEGTSPSKRQPKTQPHRALVEPTQEMFWRNKKEPIHEMEEIAKYETNSDDASIASESSGSSGLSDDAGQLIGPVERVGHGIPLFDEPEGDFNSSDDEDSESDEEEEGIDSYQNSPPHDVPMPSFEELWTLKLRRTQEMMDRSSSGSNGFH